MGASGLFPFPGGANTIPAAGHRLKESLPPGHHCGRGLAGRLSGRPAHGTRLSYPVATKRSHFEQVAYLLQKTNLAFPVTVCFHR